VNHLREIGSAKEGKKPRKVAEIGCTLRAAHAALGRAELFSDRNFNMAKTAKKKAVKITASSKRRSRGDTVKTIAAATDLKTSQVRSVFDTLTQIIAADLSKGSGEFNFNGLMKLRTVKKPATSARKGRNPFTGEEIMIKAKPASRKVRVRALRNLNGMI
jgi:nucleoid DNA-binding protein